MNNEPVAWTIKTGNDYIEFHTDQREFQETVDFYKMEEWDFEVVPLYTHPAELTDEEIDKYYRATYKTYAQYEGFVEGVKWAIGKAQEK